ncbi:MAG: DUF3387 domain-containing protein, partial [candidate division WOR-3 bacterium]|nr:DUF3387 domain-containing protein [candidate division WOR-3 bacterium]
TIKNAVEDKNVVPLYYEGRIVPQTVDKQALDSWFEKHTRDLTPEQKADLKKKYSSADHLNEVKPKIKMIAYDISIHYYKNWKGTGFKGQVVTGSKNAALQYKQCLDEFGLVSSEVLISGPDMRKGYDNVYDEPDDEIIKFWNKMMQKYGSETQYNDMIITGFKEREDPEIIIVVDKLLTGFDAPANTVLYLTRNLKDHTLLQAIARVNRLKEGKEKGYIIDYYGVLENLDSAMEFYRALPEFDKEDLRGALTDISKPISKLPSAYHDLMDTFKTIRNEDDVEEYERLLADEELRDKFYNRLLKFSKLLGIALSSHVFFENTDSETIRKYKNKLNFFNKLRASVRRRYSETVDYGEYEKQIRKLMDEHVGAKDVEQLTPLVNIFNEVAFNEEVGKLQSDASKADTIATRTKKTIGERYEEDPAFYEKFSQMLQKLIDDYRNKRISDAEYLKETLKVKDAIVNRTDEQIPGKIQGQDEAKAYYGILKKYVPEFLDSIDDNSLADIASDINNAIDKLKIVNWKNNPDIKNSMKGRIDDIILDFAEKKNGEPDYDKVDEIIERIISVAEARD